MTKYAPLANHLASLNATEWVGSFGEIETILGFTLPQSAHSYPAWWANQTTPGHSQNQGWRSVGWRTEGLDLANKSVTFRAQKPILSTAAGGHGKVTETDHALSIAQAKLALARHYDVPPENIEITIRG